MNRNYSKERPSLIVKDSKEASRVINFDVQEEENHEYSYYSVTVKIGNWSYGSIVNAIVTAEYPNDRMQAVLDNYLQETDLSKLIGLLSTAQNFNKLRKQMEDWLAERDQDIVREYEKMQEWRAMAKRVANDVLNVND